MGWMKAHRWIVVLAAVLVAAVGGIVVWNLSLPSNDDGPSMGYYGPEKQREWAERLVTGLNTRDPEQVPVIQLRSKQLPVQRVAIEAAMPALGCRYSLDSVEDRGEQAGQEVPGLSGPTSTYRFDMTVDETCPNRKTQIRSIAVIAIADMGYWEPFYFVVEDDL